MKGKSEERGEMAPPPTFSVADPLPDSEVENIIQFNPNILY